MTNYKSVVDSRLSEVRSLYDWRWNSDGRLHVCRRDQSDFMAGVVEQNVVDAKATTPLIKLNVSTIFKPTNADNWKGDAIESCEEANISWGYIDDFISACRLDDPRENEPLCIRYPRSVLKLHSCVKSLDMLYDRVVRVTLVNGKTAVIVCTGCYDISESEMRVICTQYGRIDYVYHVNPSAQVSKAARKLAREQKVQIFAQTGMLGRLRHLAKDS